MSKRSLAFWLGCVLAAGGSSFSTAGETNFPEEETPLTILPVSSARACTAKSGLCVFPGAPSTVSVIGPLASGDSAPVAVVPTFTRVSRVAAKGAIGPLPLHDAPWTLELSGAFKRAALAGNALFLVYNTDDPHSIARHEVTAFYQANIPAGHALAARVRLSPDDGFRAGHYRIRVVQIVNKKELTLGEADLSLL